MAEARCFSGRLSQLVSTLAVGAPASSATQALDARSKMCTPACYLRAVVSFSRLVTVSVAIKKYGALSMYPIGSKRWNPTSCVSLVLLLVMRKATDGTSYILTHNLIYASAKSTLLR